MAATTADQLELIKDDPRREIAPNGFQMIRELKLAREQHGDLISRPLACEVLGVTPGHLGTWITRGRLTRVDIGPMKLVPAAEVEALYLQRKQEESSKGGRGHKLPSMAEVVRLQNDNK